MDKPTIRNMHDYISVNFGQGQVFTISWNGSKGHQHPREVFTRLDDFVQRQVKIGFNRGERIQTLVEQIDHLWPDWNKPMATFAPGDRVVGPTGVQDTVRKWRTNYHVQFDGYGFITSISPTLIRKA